MSFVNIVRIIFTIIIVPFFAVAEVGDKQVAPSSKGKFDGPIVHVTIETTINPAVAEYVQKGIAHGESLNAAAVLISLNTPGGLITSMQTIVEEMLRSKVPVFVYVSPSGGGAISAGVFITLAGHIAVMAPGTTIGAAHPVNSNGENIGDDMRSKAENFAASLVKAIAEQRGRNMEWAEKAVRESVALTDSEAITQNVVDYSASSIHALLEKSKGRKIILDSASYVIPDLSGTEIVEYPMSFQQRVVSTISDPNVMALLSLAAMGGITAEFYHPGLIFPGLIGIISLVLTLVAGQVIPINVGGGLLLMLGVILISAEMFITSGILGFIGLICLILGSIYAIDTSMIWASEGFQFNPLLIGGVAGTLGLVLLFLVFLAIQERKRKVVTGKEGLIGATATVNREFTISPSNSEVRVGKVFVKGEIWNAECSTAFETPALNTEVTIISINGLVLTVKP